MTRPAQQTVRRWAAEALAEVDGPRAGPARDALCDLAAACGDPRERTLLLGAAHRIDIAG